MKKRVFSITLGMSILASACVGFAACGGSGSQGEVAGKTNISVATFNGGLGMEWLSDAAKRFEDAYAETSFEEGKTGIAIHIEESRTGDMLVNESSLDKNVYITESVDYFQFLNAGHLADISDVVKADLGSYGESGKTIESKLDASLSNFLTAKDGKYYALPFYEGFYGIIYDADMFALKGWYFDENGDFTKTNKSKGIDGIAGTYDDGLPKTYEQFGKLIEKIKLDGVLPLVYANESTPYYVNLLANFWADYEGKEDMEKNWSLTGETSIVSGFSGDTPILETLNITEENYKDLQKQPGKYYALKFLKDVLMSDGQNYQSASDFKAAQFQLIQSCLDGELQKNATAMIVDGAWFENEADLAGTFDTAKLLDFSYTGGEYKKMRNFAFMPIPMVDETSATLDAGSKTASGAHKQTLLSSNESYCFISSTTTGAKLDASKEFIKFLHSNDELAAFTAKTSITRPYTYTVSDELKATMSHYGKTLVEIKESSNVVYPYSNNSFYVANSERFRLGQWGWRGTVNGDMVSNPFTYWSVSTNFNTTAKQYFQGLGIGV